jgi:predicted NBD/HSP70 family sugar kinase
MTEKSRVKLVAISQLANKLFRTNRELRGRICSNIDYFCAAQDSDGVTPSPPEPRAARNRRTVVRLLRERGALSRADIARATGLSRSTVSGLVGELVSDGLVLDLGTAVPPAGGAAGRPGSAVMLNPATGEAIGVDFGHRHVHVIIANVAHEVRIAKSRPMPAGYHPQRGMDAAAELVREAIAEGGIDPTRILGVGVSVPCPYDRRADAPSAGADPRWTGVPVAAELSERLRLPVSADNDAQLGALAERLWGVGRDYDDVVYLKLHSAVGGALIVGGRLVRGAAGAAGEVGHLVLDPAGPLCRCGNRGCLESLVALPRIMRELEPGYGDRITLRDVITMAWQGDRGCIRALDEAGSTAGRAVAMLVNILNPQAVIVGGALAGAGELLLGPLREAAVGAALPLASAARITAGELGPQASALGAVALVLGQSEHDRQPAAGPRLGAVAAG